MKQRMIVTLVVTVSCIATAFSQSIKHSIILNDAEKQTRVLVEEVEKARMDKPDLASPRTVEKGELKMVSSRDWTSGFFPGELWFLYEFTRKNEWKQKAEAYTANLEREKTNRGTHDMGFKIYCSFGNGYRLTKNAAYRDVIIQAAKTLSTRFNPVTGCIRSWDTNRDKWGYPVIIDNMMNLELLFVATQLTGDSSFYKIAVTHANTTMKNHFRPDHSSYHVVDYDTISGKVVRKNTHQGYADESAWARGQSWGLYGYTMCFRFTKNRKYLEHAENIASFLLTHPNLPKDFVPYWDYNAPNIPNEERDASAASILASGLYELSTYSKKGKMYKEKADKIVESLTNNYRSPIGENKGFLLVHSVGHMPNKSEINVPIDYADYYYMEAALRSKKLKEKRKLW